MNRTRAKLWARRAGLVALGLLAGGLALVALALGLLRTSWGGNLARDLALTRVNAAIAGKLELGGFRYRGRSIELTGVLLRDPEGQVVLQARRAAVTFSPSALLRNRVQIDEVALEAPQLALERSARGLNLTRAIAPRTPAPPTAAAPEAKPGAPSKLVVVVERLALAGGSVHFKDLEPAGLPPVHLEAIESSGDIYLALGTSELRANLALDGRTAAPVRSPLALRVHAQTSQPEADKRQQGPTNGELRFDWAGSRVDLRAAVQGSAQVDLTIKELRVAPGLVRAFVPTYPVVPDLVLTGDARLRGTQLLADLALAAAATRAQLTADADTATMRARQVKLAVKDIDVAALVKGGPRSRFDLTITGQGGGRSAASAVGQARLEIPAGSTLSGTRFGPVQVAVAADRGRFTLSQLLAALPGLHLSGKGQGSQEAVAVEARLAATDLGLTARSLGLPARRRAQGRGQIDLTVRGPLRAPSLDAKGHLALLRIDDQVINDLRLSAHADALGRPSRASGQLRVKSVQLGARRFEGIAGDLTSAQDGSFTASLALAGPSALTVRTAGQLEESGKAVRLSRLALAHPRASWTLAQPVRIDYSAGLQIDQLDLRAPPDQRISLQLDLRSPAQRLEAKLLVAALDLGRLPPLLIPDGKRLEGKVNLDVRARGRLPRPDAELTLAVNGARFDRFAGLSLSLQARHRQGRASGQFTARALEAEHRGRFDLPVAFPPPAAAPVTLELAVGEVDLGRALAMVQHPLQGKVSGRAGLSLSVEGRAGDPALALDARTQGLRVEREALGDIVVRLRDPHGQPLTLEVDSKVFGQASQLRFSTPAVLGPWLRRPPRPDELLETPFALRATVGRLPLAALTARPGRAAPSMGGTVAVTADLRGPVKLLTGTLSADAREVSAANVPPTDATLRLRLGQGARGVDTQLRLSRKGQPIGQLQARVDAPIRDLMDEKTAARAPLVLDARLGPIVLQRVGPPAQVRRDAPRILRARVEAMLGFKGSLNQPTLDARVRAAEGHLGNTPLGNADLTLAYSEKRAVVKAVMASANGGRLVIDAQGQADLSLPALQKGLSTREIPVQASLNARKFDLTFLSGLTDAVRAVAGQLDAQANLSGTVGTPQVAGQVAWRQGRLMLAGFGEFRDIDLAFRGDQKQMVLERLFARSGSGDANITAKAVRGPDGRRLAIEAAARLNKFRLYTEGQPLGALSLQASASGQVAPDAINIATVIPEAHFQLAEGDRKKLQPLKRPNDVVIVAHGKPVDRGEERRHAELQEMRQAMIQGAAEEQAAAQAKQKVAAANRKTATGDERRIRLTVEAPRNLWVRGDDANIELGLDPNFALVSTDRTRVFGAIKVRRGQVKVFGRRFEISQNSTVTFSGAPDVPLLSVDAVYRSDKTDGPTTVQVHIEGPADRLTFNLRSPEHPEWGDSELITLIITGRAPGDEGANSAPGDRAASLVGGLVAGKLQKALASRLPLDVLNIEPGQDLEGTKLEAGTYLGDDLYVAYVGRLGADPFLRENRNELHLEYQLTPRWSFEGTYGDQRRGSADLLWTKNY